MLSLVACAVIAPTPYVVLKCEKPVVAAGEKPVFKIFIGNKGRVPALVVQPNDGSDWHWRTPFTGWAVKPASDKTAWPEEAPRTTGARCGNMNPLIEKEFVDLAPGHMVEIDQSWLHSKPEFTKPGKYKVVFYYWHISGGHRKSEAVENTVLLERIKTSESYRLRSNEVVITVK